MVILAGGLATRLRPVTEKIPKSLVPVAGRPFIDYQLTLLASAGVTDVLLCIGYLGEQIQSHCGDGSQYGMRIRYSMDGPQLLGTAGALKHAVPLLGEQFFVTYGDAYLQCDYRALWERLRQDRALGLMTVYENRNAHEQSNVVVARDHVTVYDKKVHTPAMRWIDFGVSLFRRAALDLISDNYPVDLGELNRALIARQELLAHTVPTRFYEIGSPHGLEEFDRLVRAGMFEQRKVRP